MHDKPTPWTVELYPPWSEAGPVRKALAKQSRETRARVLRKLELLEEFGPDGVGPGHVKKIRRSREGVFEFRILGVSSFRLFFVCIGRVIVVVHAFQKKRMGLTGDDIQTADGRANKARVWYEERAR